VLQKQTSVNIAISIGGSFYKLRSLILHHGEECKEGHYTTIYSTGFNPNTFLDEWYAVDDDKEIQRFNTFNEIKRNAYIFFYINLDV
jgi:uncharacterized UBP type Zn finger protein